MHTPQQARDLWCPMVRIARSENLPRPDGHQDKQVIVAGCNRDALGGGNVHSSISAGHKPLASCRCISSQCAMWRWSEDLPLPKTINCVNQCSLTEQEEHEARASATSRLKASAVPNFYDARLNPIPAGWIFIAHDIQEGILAHWMEPREAREARCTGYCGLAPVQAMVA